MQFNCKSHTCTFSIGFSDIVMQSCLKLHVVLGALYQKINPIGGYAKLVSMFPWHTHAYTELRTV